MSLSLSRTPPPRFVGMCVCSVGAGDTDVDLGVSGTIALTLFPAYNEGVAFQWLQPHGDTKSKPLFLSWVAKCRANVIPITPKKKIPENKDMQYFPVSLSFSMELLDLHNSQELLLPR